MPPRPRVVIVGGGFGGLAAARALRRVDADVVLLDRQNHHLFQPLLYQVATAALSPANIAAPIRHVLARQRNCSVYMGNVTGVDLGRGEVEATTGTWAYDYLVLAAGVGTNYFGRDDWAVHAPGLKTIDEAIDLRCRFLVAFEEAELADDADARRAALTFVIVGAGPTGVEMAGAAAEISRHTLRKDFRHFDPDMARVIVVDAAERVLRDMDAALSARAQRDLVRLGVEVRLSTCVTEVDADGVTIEGQGGAERIETRHVLWAAGVCANEQWGHMGVDVDEAGRIVVAPDLTIPGHSRVFAIGDLAHCEDDDGRLVPGVAQGALQMGRYAGRVIAEEISTAAAGGDIVPCARFEYRDKGSMATIGRNRAVAQFGGIRLGGRIAFLLWALVHITFLIDFRRRVLTFAEWTWMYFFYERGVRLITGMRWKR